VSYFAYIFKSLNIKPIMDGTYKIGSPFSLLCKKTSQLLIFLQLDGLCIQSYRNTFSRHKMFFYIILHVCSKDFSRILIID